MYTYDIEIAESMQLSTPKGVTIKPSQIAIFMGPTRGPWVMSAPGGPHVGPWTLLLGLWLNEFMENVLMGEGR